jgi:hypothetical protein
MFHVYLSGGLHNLFAETIWSIHKAQGKVVVPEV